jgi:uncharacterized protein (UPF0332 family)
MLIERAKESLRASQLCLDEELVNSAASRAYYAMFQAAQVALEFAGVARRRWSHATIQAAFTSELIHRRKIYPIALRQELPDGYGVRQAADYNELGVSRTAAHRMVRRAAVFVSMVQEVTRHGREA